MGNNFQNDHAVHIIIYDHVSSALCMNHAVIVKSKYLTYFTEE